MSVFIYLTKVSIFILIHALSMFITFYCLFCFDTVFIDFLVKIGFGIKNFRKKEFQIKTRI